MERGYPEPKPLRLFIAVDPPSAIKDRVDAVAEPFRGRIPAARWTRRDGWHVTLKFLGATWPRLMDTVREAVSATAAGAVAFESRVTSLGCFPTPTRARVLWAGLEDPDRRFGALAGKLDELLGDLFADEQRAFTPHLTLARLAPPRNLREFVPELIGTSVGSDPFPVERLVLFRSHLSPAGARYEPIFEAPLGGGA